MAPRGLLGGEGLLGHERGEGAFGDHGVLHFLGDGVEGAFAFQHAFAFGIFHPGFEHAELFGDFFTARDGGVGGVQLDRGQELGRLRAPDGAEAGEVHTKNAGEFCDANHPVGDAATEDGFGGVVFVKVRGVEVSADFGELLYVGIGDLVGLAEFVADFDVVDGFAAAGQGVGGHEGAPLLLF